MRLMILNNQTAPQPRGGFCWGEPMISVDGMAVLSYNDAICN